jgi:hypothetical protein
MCSTWGAYFVDSHSPGVYDVVFATLISREFLLLMCILLQAVAATMYAIYRKMMIDDRAASC